MFIDYIALMLLNATAGLVLLGGYVAWGLPRSDQRLWAPAFAAVGLVALLTGGHMILCWPLPGPYNSAFGEMSVLLGAAFLAAALALGKGWPLLTVGIYGALAGLAAIVIGARVIQLQLTQTPRLTGAGFILTGISAVLVLAALAARGAKPLRVLAAIGLFASAGIWGFIGYGAYWMHMQSLQRWLPATMHGG